MPSRYAAAMQVAPLRFRPRATPKGRQVDAAARDAVRAACGGLTPRRDLLIEYLHRCKTATARCAPATSPRWRST